MEQSLQQWNLNKDKKGQLHESTGPSEAKKRLKLKLKKRNINMQKNIGI